MYFIFFVTGASLFLWFERVETSLFNTGIDISMLVFFFIISFILIPVIRKFTSTKNYWMFILPLVFGIIFIIFAEIARRFFYDNEIIRLLLDGTVRMIPGIYILVLYAVLVPVLVISKSYLRKKLLKITGE